MINFVEIEDHVQLADYATFIQLFDAVHALRSTAQTLVHHLQGRTVWMINSTAQGGGVAEMLPKVVVILRELGVRTEWVVMGTEEVEFFSITKRIHNLIHNFGDAGFNADDRALYEKVSREVASELVEYIHPEDIVVIHDPQPLGVGAELKRRIGVRAIWRCHIGCDVIMPATESAWGFLEPYATGFDHAVFSVPDYIPSYLKDKSSIIYPALDPLSHKNRELSAHKLVGILCNAGLMIDHHPVLTPHWENQAMRLQPDGTFVPPKAGYDVGLLYRPIITQVSRWDRLKGWKPLLEGFLRLKRRVGPSRDNQTRRERRITILRLILAGPDPAAVQDDPEGQEVLEELCALYRQLAPWEQESVALLTLPMISRKENALMVNAIQRCSTVVVQNSIREGFGLTATEAMWKRVSVLGTSTCGIRIQVRHGMEGLITQDPEDPEEIAGHLDYMLSDPVARDIWGRSGQRQVHHHFLVFTQVREWLHRLVNVAGMPSG
jgi:trehalose synthase